MASSHFFEYSGLRFHYRETGAGVPFLFQHGLGGDHTQTFGLCTPPPHFRLLTLDCRGHGETRPLGPEDALNIPQFMDDIHRLLDQLRVAQIVLGGISMGAAVALEFTLRFPDRVQGLVLSRPAWLDEVREVGFEMFGHIAGLIRRYGAFEGAIRFQESAEYAQIVRTSPDNALSLLAQFAHPRADETVAKLERIPRHCPTFPRTQWGSIQVPTLVLGNRKDLIHPFEFAVEHARLIPNAEFRELTPKSQDKLKHDIDHQSFLDEFLMKHW